MQGQGKNLPEGKEQEAMTSGVSEEEEEDRIPQSQGVPGESARGGVPQGEPRRRAEGPTRIEPGCRSPTRPTRGLASWLGLFPRGDAGAS